MTGASRHAMLAGGLVACLLGGGCQDSEPAVCAPGLPAGRIQGTVRTGGLAPQANVIATGVAMPPGTHGAIQVGVRSDGSYAMDVPAGRYTIRLQITGEWGQTYVYSAAGLRPANGAADTLLVDAAHSPVTADFVLASMRVHVALSTALDGQTGQVNLYSRGQPPWNSGSSSRAVGSAEVIHGALDLDIVGIPPGVFRTEVVAGTRPWSSSYDGEHFWIPGVWDSAAAPWIEVRAGQATEVTGSVGQPARVQGSLRGAWQSFGFSPPMLAYYAPDSSIARGPRTVAADGSFDDAIYVPRPVKLLVRQEGIDAWIGGRDFATATIYSLTPGQTIAGIQYAESGLCVQMEAPHFAPGTLWFTLYDATTGSPVDTESAYFGAATRVGFANLLPGTYRLRVYPDFGRAPWLPQWFDRAGSAAAATPVIIAAAGDIPTITVRLEEGGTIAGTVHEVPGVISDYYFYVTPAENSAVWGSARASRPTTTYMVQGLPDGDWKLGVQRRSPSPVLVGWSETLYWYPGTTDWQAASVIQTRGLADVTGIDFNMPTVPR